MTATNTKSDKPYHASSETRMKMQSALNKNETINEPTRSFENENAYFSNRMEATMFGHK